MASFKKITSSPSPAGNKASVCSDKAGIELRNILSNHRLPHSSPWPSGKRRLFFSFCNNIESAFGQPSVGSRSPRFELFFFLFFLSYLVCVSFIVHRLTAARGSVFVCICPSLYCVGFTQRGKKKKIDFCCHLVHHAQVCRLPLSLETSEPRSTSQPSLTPNEPLCQRKCQPVHCTLRLSHRLQ